jgi:hypothetical protein
MQRDSQDLFEQKLDDSSSFNGSIGIDQFSRQPK